MNANMEAKFKPYEAPAARNFSDAKVASPDGKATDSTEKAEPKASFRDVLLNSNDETARDRAAQKNGDMERAAKSDEEFAKMMSEKANKLNERKPQNELDKDAFLKLFVTQMRNQDPLSPDNSTQMAAQLAQFHGLEQMMNVNKNLEKMQNDDATGRAVGLINFVGKDIKLANGKLLVDHGELATQATMKLDREAAKANLEIRDGAGVVVAQEDLGPVAHGEAKLQWSGRGKDGKPLASGAYTFSITAIDQQGQPIDAKITSTVPVTGVDLHDNGGSFFTPIGKVGIRDVASVGTTGFSTAESTPAMAAAKAEPKPSGGGMELPFQGRATGPGESAKPEGDLTAAGAHGNSAPVTTRPPAAAAAGAAAATAAAGATAAAATVMPQPAVQKPLAMNPLGAGSSPAAASGSPAHKERSL